MTHFKGKLAVLQRVLPSYRAGFFDHLAQQCDHGLALAAGNPLPIESIQSAQQLGYAQLTSVRNQHLFHPRHPLFLCRQTGLAEWLERENPDVLVVEANPRYISTHRAIEWMRRRSRPVLGWGLGAPPITGRFSGTRLRSREKLLSSLDGIIAYSGRGADEYRALGILPPDRVFTAFNAVTPPPAHAAPARPPLAAPPHVLFVGRLQARKRVDLLIRACAALPEHLQPIITIVGDGPARQEFEAAAAAYPHVTFTGELHGEPLAKQFEAADLFVLPGSGGLAIQEAMSYALPVIVAEGDGSQEDLVRPENGWLVPPGSLDALKRTLQTALSDPALREKGLAGRRIVVDEINLHSMADRFIEAVNSVLHTS